jgi:hypothetical protein
LHGVVAALDLLRMHNTDAETEDLVKSALSSAQEMNKTIDYLLDFTSMKNTLVHALLCCVS